MKIAVATDGAVVSPHFGHCSEFTVVTVEDGKIVGSTALPNPEHQPGFLPQYLFEHGVSCIIAGGMGPRAEELFAAKGIQTVIGASGNVDDVIKSYLSGSLEVGESACDHVEGDEGHEGCGHEHHGETHRNHECGHSK